MRHRKAGIKLGRTTSHRKAMLRNMVTSLFQHERIVTTEAKAKAAGPMAEKLITLAKRGDLHARRLALSVLTKKDVSHKLFSELRERYMDRTGGYTTIVRLGPRRGDAALMAVLELVKPEETVKTKKKARKRKGGKKKTAEAPATSAPKKEMAVEAEPGTQTEEVKPEEPSVKADSPEMEAQAEIAVQSDADAQTAGDAEPKADTEVTEGVEEADPKTAEEKETE